VNNIKYKLGEQLEFNGIAYKVNRIEIFQSKGGATIVIDLNDVEPEVESYDEDVSRTTISPKLHV
jgi:signal recognition particle GTPase